MVHELYILELAMQVNKLRGTEKMMISVFIWILKVVNYHLPRKVTGLISREQKVKSRSVDSQYQVIIRQLGGVHYRQTMKQLSKLLTLDSSFITYSLIEYISTYS